MQNQMTKAAEIQRHDVTEDELKQINQYTLKDLSAEEVYTFKLVLCDNEIDRTKEAFPLKSLERLQDLFVGKTVITDHSRQMKNQCARIFDTYVERTGGQTGHGEPYHRLVAKCYTLRTESNKDLILEIDAGIKKEASVGVRVDSIICSVCGVDNRKRWCDHLPGKSYDGKDCYFTLEEPTDAYEVSFVAVPAQVAAGTVKDYGGAKEETPTEERTKTIETDSVKQRLRLMESYLFLKHKEETR